MKRLLGVFFGFILGIMLFANTVEAATPRVMVSDYKVAEGKVIGGKEFTLKVTLKNTAAKAVKNVKLTLSTENGELLPVEGAGTAYIDEIAADSEQEFTFKMKAISGLQEKSYKMTIKTEYESAGGYEYTVDESIFLPVTMEQRFSVTDIFLENGELQLGDTAEITAMVNNMGEGSLYNVVATVKGDNLEEMSSYVGNIESGKSGMVDIITKATVVTAGDHKKNEIIISYEDKEGISAVQKMEIDVSVTQPLYEKLEKVKKDNKGAQVVKIIIEIVVAVIVLVGGIFLYLKRKKKKQQMLEEFIK